MSASTDASGRTISSTVTTPVGYGSLTEATGPG
jgi:hypothetical protein